MTSSRPVIWVSVAVALAVAATGAFLVFSRADEPAEPPGPRVVQGTVAVDEGIRFEMVDGRCGYARVVTATSAVPPGEGEFCLVRLHVQNQTQEQRTLDRSCQFLIDTRGNRYSQAEEVLLDPTSKPLFKRGMKAGQLVEDAALYYDVPKGTKTGSVVLHGSCESRGVQLRVLEPADDAVS